MSKHGSEGLPSVWGMIEDVLSLSAAAHEMGVYDQVCDKQEDCHTCQTSEANLEAAITKVRGHIERLAEELETTRAVLRDIQYCARGGGVCPKCGSDEEAGHDPECLIDVALNNGEDNDKQQP